MILYSEGVSRGKRDATDRTMMKALVHVGLDERSFQPTCPRRAFRSAEVQQHSVLILVVATTKLMFSSTYRSYQLG